MYLGRFTYICAPDHYNTLQAFSELSRFPLFSSCLYFPFPSVNMVCLIFLFSFSFFKISTLSVSVLLMLMPGMTWMYDKQCRELAPALLICHQM